MYFDDLLKMKWILSPPPGQSNTSTELRINFSMLKYLMICSFYLSVVFHHQTNQSMTTTDDETGKENDCVPLLKAEKKEKYVRNKRQQLQPLGVVNK